MPGRLNETMTVKILQTEAMINLIHTKSETLQKVLETFGHFLRLTIMTQ